MGERQRKKPGVYGTVGMRKEKRAEMKGSGDRMVIQKEQRKDDRGDIKSNFCLFVMLITSC